MPEPDPRLLRETGTRLGFPPDRIEAAPSAKRARSVLTPLLVDDTIVAWYKQILPRGDPAGHSGAETVRDQLRRTRACTDAATEALRGSDGLTLAPVLAVDPSALRIVTAHVEGAPFGRPLPRKRRGARLCAAQLRRIGRGLALIESATPGPAGADPSNAHARIHVPLDMVRAERDLLPDNVDFSRLAERVDIAWATVEREGLPSAAVHGDVSGTNVLVDGHRIGFIDTEWPWRLIGFDLATLAVRLELDAARFPFLGAWAVDRLLEGYETIRPVGAGFHFERTQRFLRMAATGALSRGASRRVAADYLAADHPVH